MKTKPTKKVPAVVEQGRKLNLNAIAELLEDAGAGIFAAAYAIRMRSNETAQKNAVVEQKANEMLARVAKHQGITLNEMLASAA
jgi:hypothetical protein